MISKASLVKFVELEKKVSKFSDADCENPTPEVEALLMEYLRLVDKYDAMGICLEGYCLYYDLERV